VCDDGTGSRRNRDKARKCEKLSLRFKVKRGSERNRRGEDERFVALLVKKVNLDRFVLGWLVPDFLDRVVVKTR
jgi:hypothetical protein